MVIHPIRFGIFRLPSVGYRAQIDFLITTVAISASQVFHLIVPEVRWELALLAVMVVLAPLLTRGSELLLAQRRLTGVSELLSPLTFSRRLLTRGEPSDPLPITRYLTNFILCVYTFLLYCCTPSSFSQSLTRKTRGFESRILPYNSASRLAS